MVDPGLLKRDGLSDRTISEQSEKKLPQCLSSVPFLNFNLNDQRRGVASHSIHPPPPPPGICPRLYYVAFSFENSQNTHSILRGYSGTLKMQMKTNFISSIRLRLNPKQSNRPGVHFLKAPKSFRPRKAIHKNMNHSIYTKLLF